MCHRTVKFRQRGEEGNGFKAVVYRDGVFTEAQWNTFGTIGHVESWNNTSGSRNGCREGDLFQVVGSATDTLNSHVLTYRCNNSSGNLAGTCIAHQMTPAGEKGFGITLTLTRSNLYTEANWNSYAAIGHTETYNKRDGDSDLTICRVGDYFVVSGTSSDKGLNHTATYKCTSVNANQIAGSCVSHTKDGVQGNTGKAGRWYEYAGEYGVDLPSTLTNTDSHGWWVKRGNNCFMLIAASGTAVQTSTVPSTAAGNSTWELMTGDTRKLFIGAAFFGAYAHLGSFIVNVDWMISQYGTLYDANGNPTTINASNYQTLVEGHLPYTYFNTSYPISSASGSINFCPAFAIDGKTGKAYFSDAYFNGEINAESGAIGGFTIGSDSLKSVSDKIAIYSDGHGQLGGGGISWNASGVFSITSAFVNAILKALAAGYYKTYSDGGSSFYSSNEMKIADGKIFWSGSANNVASWLAEASENGFVVHKVLHGVVDDDTKVSVNDSEIKLERSFTAFDQTTNSDFAVTSEGGKSTKRFKFACVSANGNTEYAFIELIGVYGDNQDSSARISANDVYIEAESDVYLRGARQQGSTFDGWIHIDSSGAISASGSTSIQSDERLKNIVDVIDVAIEEIAKARIVDYYFKTDKAKKVALGSIAQDWQKVFPNAVKEQADGTLTMDYSAIALASAVAAAKEITKLKEENENLKKRLAAIEEKLGIKY